MPESFNNTFSSLENCSAKGYTVTLYKSQMVPHDFGSNSEIVLVYDDNTFNQWDENDPEKFNRFL